jgi:hypothetical protein
LKRIDQISNLRQLEDFGDLRKTKNGEKEFGLDFVGEFSLNGPYFFVTTIWIGLG